jgi:geranylgeranyl pyrophosphate synthase
MSDRIRHSPPESSLAVLAGLPFPVPDFVRDRLTRQLFEPLTEFLSRPGKNLRAQLVRLGMELAAEADLTPEQLRCWERLSEIVEAIHAGSLIVDDIQDNSAERRGEPCFHRLHGAAQAINAGNWLYFWSLQLLRQAQLEPAVAARIEDLIIDALLEGHLGQALDLSVPIDMVPREEVAATCDAAMNLKTGCLTSLALCAGALAGAIPAPPIENLKALGYRYGLLLQSYDDLKNFRRRQAPDPKCLEDLRHRRPSYLWSLVSRRGSPEQFAHFIDLTRHLEDPTPLWDWVEEHQLLATGLAELAALRAELVAETSRLPFPGANRFCLSIDNLINRLVVNYEQT